MKCEYCRKDYHISLIDDRGYANDKFCSKECEDNYDSAIAVNLIKGDIMETMRTMAKGDVKREILFLDGLTTCLKLDLKERQKSKMNCKDCGRGGEDCKQIKDMNTMIANIVGKN